MTELQDDIGQDTLMGSLADRRDVLAKEQILVLKVPRWEEPVMEVTYRPLDVEETAEAFRKVPEADNKEEAMLNAQCSLLNLACTGVSATWPDKPAKTWAGFNHDLAKQLGVTDPPTAIKTVRRLFLTSPDILRHYSDLSEWSSSANKNLRVKFSGE